MSKRFEIVKPKSYTNPEYADIEYLLRWIGSDGADYQYLFYDAEISEGNNAEVINKKSESNIASILGDDERSITLTASDISKNDLSVFLQMLRNTYVTRIRLDGTIERYAVDSNSFNYKLSDLRYNISFTIIPYSRPQWK